MSDQYSTTETPLLSTSLVWLSIFCIIHSLFRNLIKGACYAFPLLNKRWDFDRQCLRFFHLKLRNFGQKCDFSALNLHRNCPLEHSIVLIVNSILVRFHVDNLIRNCFFLFRAKFSVFTTVMIFFCQFTNLSMFV